MTGLLDHAILLAQASRWNSMSQRFQGRNSRIDLNDVLTGLLILGAAISVFWVISLVVRLRDEHRTFSSPTALFLSLCKAHRLRWHQRWLLWRVARAHRLRDPAQVFVRPELFDSAKLEPALRHRHVELMRLGKMLFLEPAEGEENAKKDDEKPDKRQSPEHKEKAEAKPAAATEKATSTEPPSSELPPALDVAPWPPLSGFEQEASKG